ncbi:non-ribosomal peptide synthetase [Leptothoe spongobia]|uniref:Amino acid adenylation domain-containing protein n=1 Tax=Leptothoe spongobia TAU-MAC 1115 TaxID=1967444 RepID=A0A947DFN4_9CYAN|nr:non-ribosomal peptide synthetase [Leptothoe spongobia]MBT9315784.1 amino acid adenylation domain-containing protein [Leptothoe spongobia TAU-MAC 1115]
MSSVHLSVHLGKSLLSEQQQLHPHSKCIHELFSECAARNPERKALTCGDESITYRELDFKTNRLAYKLRQLGVDRNTPVAICAERSPKLLAGLLAILKAGGAYLPLDTGYPTERITLMLAEVKPTLILVERKFVDHIPQFEGTVLCLDDVLAKGDYTPTPPVNHTHSDDLAYILYTSGSTGHPKAVCIPHKGVIRLVCGTNWAPFDDTEIWLQFAPIGFDASTLEIWGPLLNGAHLVVCPPQVKTVSQVAETIREYEITSAFLTTALFHAMTHTVLSDLVGLKLLIVGGETLSPTCAQKFLAACPNTRVVNGYGPTENTTFTTIHTVTPADLQEETIPIGRPISKTRVYILDSQLRSVAGEQSGELCIAGDGLAHGYLNRPGETTKRFVAAPHLAEPTLYRTGDRARWRSDGVLEFLGRIDNQIKIRGYRIEPGEIEAVLEQHESIHSVAVAIRSDASDRNQLAAYFVADSVPPPNGAELRQFLQRSLPAHMIPTFYVALDELPLTPNGKLDRKALPNLGRGATGVFATFQASCTDLQQQLADLWATVLDIDQVGIVDDFIELGGDSLLAAELVAAINTQFQVAINIGQLFSARTVAVLADEISAQFGQSGNIPLQAVPRHDSIPLSFAQQRMWFIAQQLDHMPLYNEPLTVTLPGAISTTAMEQALQYVVRRHEVLRTTIHIDENGQPYQTIQASYRFHLPVLDLQSLPSAQEREQVARHTAQKMLQTPFKLTTDLMIRGLLVHIDADTSRLYLAFHHIAIDAESIFGILRRELPVLYDCCTLGQKPDLPALPIQYADYAHWQRQVLEKTDLSARLAYWRKTLEGAEETQLPGDRLRSAQPQFRGKSHCIQLPAPLWKSVQSVGHRHGVTPFVTLLSAFLTLIHRYTSAGDLLIGTVSSERNHPALAGVFGQFLNTLALRVELSGNLSFAELLNRVNHVLRNAQNHEVPFDWLVQQLPWERSQNSPLVRLMFVMEPACSNDRTDWGFDQYDLHSGTSKFDLTVEVEEWLDSVRLRFEYNTDLFETATIERLAQHYCTLVEHVVADPLLPLMAIDYIPVTELALLTKWGDKRANFPVSETLHQQFSAQAQRTPDAIAVIDGDDRQQSLTYRELDALSSQLACYLQSHGVGPAIPVGLCMERCVDLMVAILGILKAGGIYVPVDPIYPETRLSFILKDANVALVLTHSCHLSRLPQHINPLCLDQASTMLAQYAKATPVHLTDVHSGAYIIYTSGSTGKPKGVLASHGNVMRLLAATEQWFQFNERDVWCLFHSIAFDFAVWEMYGALLHGGQLVVVSHATSRAPDTFHQLLCKHKVTVLCQTPSAFQQLMLADARWVGEAELCLRYIIFGGEALEPSALQPWVERHGDQTPALINMYGITETTVHVTYRPIRLADIESGETSCIGRPIPDLEMRLLDQYQQPVPIGIPGEIHVGGGGLTLGYVNLPELTAERFVAHPLVSDSGRRLYRSGDLGRYLPNGDIQYLGRIDHQVKIRGFRIELGEIERVLVDHPAVRDAIVICHPENKTNTCLWAYVVANEKDISHNHLRAFLSSRLPDYMLPAGFIVLTTLPITAHGKIDRKALPPPTPEQRLSATDGELPRTAYEQHLCQLWANHLRLDHVGVNDDFFSLGGHSLLAVALCLDIQQHFSLSLETNGQLLRALLEYPDVKRYAAWLTEFVAPHGQLPKHKQVDFFAEAQLDPSIEISAASSQQVGGFSEVLLTGATGFLGIALLQVLLHRTTAQIHCLVRGDDVAQARARIEKALARFPMFSPESDWQDRIIPIPGDLSKPRFGLSEAGFNTLANTIDLILHNGAQVNFMYPYSALRGANVDGTQEIIRLASHGCTTPVHYVSTLSVGAVSQFHGAKRVYENDPITNPEDICMGYTESKWVSEQILFAAQQQGLPVTIYRPKDISGHSQTGRWKTHDLITPCIFHAIVDLGIAPKNFFCVDMLPVDYASELIVHIASTQAATGQTYHLTNLCAGGMSQVIERLRVIGYPIERCEYDDWCEKLTRYVIDCPDVPIAPFVPLFVEKLDCGLSVVEMYFEDRLPQFDDRYTQKALAGSNLVCPPVDNALLDRHLKYFVDCGFFPSPQNTYTQIKDQQINRVPA